MATEKPLQKLASAEMSRRQFLGFLGAAALAAIGVTGIIKGLNGLAGREVSDGYGSSAYGGSRESH